MVFQAYVSTIEMKNEHVLGIASNCILILPQYYLKYRLNLLNVKTIYVLDEIRENIRFCRVDRHNALLDSFILYVTS